MNLMSALGAIEAERSKIEVKTLILFPALVRSHQRETEEAARERLRAIRGAWPLKPDVLSSEDLSIARELFGAAFLTDKYPFKDAQFIEVP